ncbi:helix-turn-helix domain-containing protein [Amycolatopsis benzoatilytica]|uniref:helix-turn-helix domain-containing protein n=1 Tax=Amycolatopsis benzoatilytica TaxID=346045 RepID=UPI000363B2C5|nr:helix-turn-helix transcriptional regulator [Amycolatopsis benzoatilytica]
MTEDPTPRLLAFADQLRQIRVARTPKLTGRALAELLEWGPMKVSLIERGKQVVTEPELTQWARALGVPEHVHVELLRELRAIRLDQAAWKHRLRRGGHESLQRSFAEVEHDASKIVCVDTAVVPGLAQTPAYARAVFEKNRAFRGAGGDTDAAVAARMERQQIIYDASKTIEVILFESCLRSGFVPADVRAGQIDRLIALTHLKTVRVGIVPLDAELPVPPLHGFWLFDDTTVTVEAFHTEIATRDSDDAKLYTELVAALWQVAKAGEAARTLLQRVLGDLASAN